MELSEDAKIGIITGASVGIVAIVVVIIIAYCCCSKSNAKKSKMRFSRRDLSHLTRPLPIKLDVESSLTKPPPLYILPRSFDHTLSPLPRVGSSGLWLSRSTMLGPSLSVAPHFATKMSQSPHSALMKATSEPRLAGQQPFTYGNIGMYHSQHMPPLCEIYEPRHLQNTRAENSDGGRPTNLRPLKYPEQRLRPTNLSDPYLAEPISVYEGRAMPRETPGSANVACRFPYGMRNLTTMPPQTKSQPFREILQVHPTAAKGTSGCPSDYSDNFFFRSKSVPFTSGGSGTENSVLAKLHRSKAPSGSSQSDYMTKYRDDNNNPDQTGTGRTATSGYDSSRSDMANERSHLPLSGDVVKRGAINNNNVIIKSHQSSTFASNSPGFEQSALEAKRVTQTAFEFLDSYLADDDQLSNSGSDMITNTKESLTVPD